MSGWDPVIGRKVVKVEYPDPETLVIYFEDGLSLTLPNENWLLAWTRPPKPTGRETCLHCREFRGLTWIDGHWYCWRHRRLA